MIHAGLVGARQSPMNVGGLAADQVTGQRVVAVAGAALNQLNNSVEA